MAIVLEGSRNDPNRARAVPVKKAATPLPTGYNTQLPRNNLQSLNDTPEDRLDYQWTQAVRQANAAAGKPPPTVLDIGHARATGISDLAASIANRAAPRPAAPAPRMSLSSSGSRGGGGGGGGGGGAAAAPKMSQAMIDWLASVLRSGGPVNQSYVPVDLPDAPAFNPAQYDQALSAWNQAGTSDQNVINQSGQDMLSFLTNNYHNAYEDPSVGTGGTPIGMDPEALRRVLQLQGVDPNSSAGLQGVSQEAARAAAMAGNWRQAMSANEQQAQQNRIGNSMSSTANSTNALNAALGGGRLQIGQARTQGEAAAQQQAWQAAVQEATLNNQGLNAVNASNTQATDSYRNAMLQQLMALASANVGNTGITLPTLQSLGLA